MKILKNIFSLIIALTVLLLAGCQPANKVAEEKPTPTATSSPGDRGFDPLGLPGDKDIVPQENPKSGEIVGKVALIDATPVKTDTTASTTAAPPMKSDSVNGQAYRIQLYTSKLYSEARHELRVAEEIFDRPVFLDYEVPYYKIRVGSFADRDKADEYLQRVKAAGYPTAWVVIVNVGVKEAAPLYRDTAPVQDIDTTYNENDDQNGEG